MLVFSYNHAVNLRHGPNILFNFYNTLVREMLLMFYDSLAIHKHIDTLFVKITQVLLILEAKDYPYPQNQNRHYSG